MIRRRPFQAWLPIEVLSVRAARDSIAVPKQTSSSQFRQKKFNDIFERLWEQCISLES